MYNSFRSKKDGRKKKYFLVCCAFSCGLHELASTVASSPLATASALLSTTRPPRPTSTHTMRLSPPSATTAASKTTSRSRGTISFPSQTLSVVGRLVYSILQSLCLSVCLWAVRGGASVNKLELISGKITYPGLGSPPRQAVLFLHITFV